MLTIADIHEARDRIVDSIDITPCDHSEILSQKLGCELYLKLENLQITGSFKPRGAFNRIMQLDAQQKAKGVAYAARRSNISATIVMPETTPLAKIRGTQGLGATIVLYGSRYGDAYEKAKALQQQGGCTFVHAFDDPEIIAGQGTIGLEVLEQVPDMDVIVVPIGGGGLIAGIALAIKETRPEVRIVGVETERLPAMRTSIAAGKVMPLHPSYTIADGISVAKVGQHTLPLVAQFVSEIVTASEEQIAHAIMTLLEGEKTLAEGAGAIGFAALDTGQISDIKGKKVVVLISGGNIDMTMLSRILDRGLESDGRLARLKVIVPDTPGNFAQLASLVAEHHANILEICQNRFVSEVALEETEIELLLEAKGWEHIDVITASIRKRGFKVK